MKEAWNVSCPHRNGDRVHTVTIFNASWNTLGGGEKYVCTMAETLAATKAYDVKLIVDTSHITRERLARYFGLTLDHVTVEHTAMRDVADRMASSDIGIFVSNYRFFGNPAKKNIYILQIPYPTISLLRIAVKAGHGHLREAAKDLFRASLLRGARNADRVLVYSDFVRHVLHRSHAIESTVLYPSIDDFALKRRKGNVILSVGRFFRGLYNEKRYDKLIEAFKQFSRRNSGSSWEFRLVGSCGADARSRGYVDWLRSVAKGFPVSFYVNAPYADLRRHYNEATLFWHAAGYGIDENKFPEQTEHFGMSTAEAMSARCVPLVMNKGGLKEIVSDGESGYLWNTVDELVERTTHLIRNKRMLQQMQKGARARFQNFNRTQFSKRCVSIFNQMDAQDYGKR